MMLCFVALFIQLNNIQVLKANSLATSQSNPRVQLVERSQTRGEHPLRRRACPGLLGAGPANERLQVPAGIQPRTPPRSSPRSSGSTPSSTGTSGGSRPSTTATSLPTRRPATTLRDLLVNRTEHGQRDPDHQREPADAGGRLSTEHGHTAVQRGGGRGAQSRPPGPSKPCTPTPPSTPIRWSSTRTRRRGTTRCARPPRPAQRRAARWCSGPMASSALPARRFKVVTTSAVLEHDPTWPPWTIPPCRT